MNSSSISVHERRRRAPLHYYVKAENAQFSAYVLWSASSEVQPKAREVTGYGGSSEIALLEAFWREAAIAVELIVKAVIAQRIELGCAKAHVTRVRPTHDLPSLWADAELPILPAADLHRLLIARSILTWSGRYAAPKNDLQYERELKDQKDLEDVVSYIGSLKLTRPRPFRWQDVDRIFGIASNALWHLREQLSRSVTVLSS